MKFLFVASNQSIALGSYRIWVHDLSKTLSELGCETEITTPQDPAIIQKISKVDVVICAKSDYSSASVYKQYFPDKLIGAINIPRDGKVNLDFVIVGSLEEKDSLAKYPNVFMYPLVERMFMDSFLDPSLKEDKKKFRIGYHGSHSHLSKMEPAVTRALNSLSKSFDLELLVVTDKPNFNWTVGKPNIPIIMKAWDYNTVKDDLLTCDIGIVPNCTFIDTQTLATNQRGNDWDKGLYITDYVVRFKNKSNAGRCFVWHQLGVPVVADFTPSHFHILGDSACGYIAFTPQGWEKSLRELLEDKEKRSFCSWMAWRKLDKDYNIHSWANYLLSAISKLKKD